MSPRITVLAAVLFLAGLSHAQSKTSSCNPTEAELAAMYHQTLAGYELHSRVIAAHGLVMGVAFAVMYPLGATLIRAGSFKGTFWFHAGWQVLAYLLTLGGLGTGVWLAITQNMWMETGHAIIGLVVTGLIALLPPLGWIHHVYFKKHGTRSVSTYLHRWLGRFVLVVGGVNGGLGFWLGHNKPAWGILAYSTCAAAFYTLWLAAVMFMNMHQKRMKSLEAGSGEGNTVSPAGSQSTLSSDGSAVPRVAHVGDGEKQW